MITTPTALYLTATMPTADIFDAGKTAATDFTGLIWTLAGAFAAFIFLTWLLKVKTFVSAIAAIGMGALLMFGIELPQEGTADGVLKETVQEWTKGSTTNQSGEAPVRPKG